MDSFFGYIAVKQYLAGSFPSTVGHITQSQVTEHDDSEGGTTRGVDIQYDYVVNGRTYHGKRFRYGAGSSTDDAWAWDAVGAHATGGETKVFYRPDRPEESLLSVGIDGSNLFQFLFLTPFNAVTIGFGLYAGRVFCMRGKSQIAGGVKILTEGIRLRVRLAAYPIYVEGLATLGLLAFIAIFVVLIFGGGFHPSMEVARRTWFIVLATSAALGAWRWIVVNSGVEDLVIDEASGTLDLPKRIFRRRRVGVPISDLASVEASCVVHKGEDDSNTYSPVLKFKDANAPDAKLATWSSETRTRLFVEWLRERLHLPVQDARLVTAQTA